MIRCYLGAGLLAVLLALGLFSGTFITERREQVLTRAEQALEAANQEQWEEAARQVAQARHLWERDRALNSVLSDHASLDNVDDAFAVAQYARDPGDYSRLCRCLETLAREQAASLENIL